MVASSKVVSRVITDLSSQNSPSKELLPLSSPFLDPNRVNYSSVDMAEDQLTPAMATKDTVPMLAMVLPVVLLSRDVVFPSSNYLKEATLLSAPVSLSPPEVLPTLARLANPLLTRFRPRKTA
mgnify:CR=1 FL=1